MKMNHKNSGVFQIKRKVIYKWHKIYNDIVLKSSNLSNLSI